MNRHRAEHNDINQKEIIRSATTTSTRQSYREPNEQSHDVAWSCIPQAPDQARDTCDTMSKKNNVHFQNRERRLSQGSMPDIKASRSPSRANGAKSPTRSGGAANGSPLKERPGVDRTDTSASGWATENEDDVRTSSHQHATGAYKHQ